MKNIISKLVWLIIIAPAIYLAIVWNQLPETVAMHYDLQGNPDRYGNKRELIGLTAILIGVNMLVYLLLTNIYRLDPKKYAADNKDRLGRIAFAVSIFMSALLLFIIYSSRQNNIKLNASIIFSGVGLLFAVIGNYLPNLKPNYFAGLRLPWTLESPDNWKKTHALAGRLWFAGGLFIAAICLFLPAVLAIIVFFVIMCVITIIPCVYSYRIYKAQKQNP
ncbi:hypothetical protein CAP36_10115 [Chitinophagaceae bacterium IBVUCB2]|nr:hypothetical protein CAP36_10115 [Chitinophagaceae bacterium IBVUCB2]